MSALSAQDPVLGDTAGASVSEVVIHPIPLTTESFAPFGQVIEQPERDPDLYNDSGTVGWKFDFKGGPLTLMLLSAPPSVGRTVRTMEAHAHVTQTFLPAGGAPAVLVVAPATAPGELPSPESVRAFALDGTRGYILSIGTWHSLDRFPMTDESTQWVILTDEETQSDLDNRAHKPVELTRFIDLESDWGHVLRIEE